MGLNENLIFYLFLIIVFLFLFLLITAALKHRRMQQENYNLIQQQDFMEIHYQALQEHLDSIRKFRHDIANHLQTLNHLMKDETNPSVFIEHGQTFKNHLDTLKKIDYCDDIVIDAVLHNKQTTCENHQITVTFDLVDFNRGDIETIHLVCLLYNVFDNAIESCQKIADTSKRYIRLTTRCYHNYLLITMKNSIPENQIINHDLKTTKEKKYRHGAGIPIIKDIVEMYDGKMEYQTADNYFKIILYLKNQ